ncbi:MAG: SIS domain-containing protein [Acidimicrobiia bacterium]|nr:SIS domain-containing protein [Acidimicrobiia bacterium]
MTMRDEILEQPSVFERVLSENAADVAAIAAGLNDLDFSYALIAARGTSDNAARYAKYLWAAHNRLPVALAAPSLFTSYQSPPALDGALVVGISQSGESPDLVAVVAEGRRQGRPTLAITNEPESPLAAEADFVLDIRAGEETAVAATKTYTAQLMAVAMLSDYRRYGAPSAELTRTPELMASVLETEPLIADIAKDFADLRSCAVLGRGFNHSTAFEWALKIQEVTYALAHPYSSADFRHGPIAVVEPGFSLMAAAPDGPLFGDMLALLEDVSKQRHARTVTISNRGEALEASRYGIPLPEATPEWVSPMPIIAAAQLFTYHLGTIKGLDTEKPRGLSKVTKTT